MAPFPDEVDVFTGPHSRMKELVEVYSVKLHCTDFSNNEALESFLNSLDQTFCEFKTHEQIENQFIMSKLKSKLKALHIRDTSVCNCHNDSQLSDMLALVKDGYSCTKKSQSEKINYGLKLQHALEEFTKDFLPHMKEEEEVFQPLLVKYFGYEELKNLKKLVLKEHEHVKWRHQLAETEKYCSDINEKCSEPEYFSKLPVEVLHHIFTFLSPRDLIRVSGVSKLWNQTAYSPNLWSSISPTRWTKGAWSAYEPCEDYCFCRSHNCSHYTNDEDADIDESNPFKWSESKSQSCFMPTCKYNSLEKEKLILNALVQHVLPKVGVGVKEIYLAFSAALSNNLLRSILILCPNVTKIDVSDTNIGDSAFKGLPKLNACRKIVHIDLSGSSISDCGLLLLARCLAGSSHTIGRASRSVSSSMNDEETTSTGCKNSWCQDCPFRNMCVTSQANNYKLRHLALSGCYKVTDLGLDAITKMGVLSKIEYLDLSGCSDLSGDCISKAVKKASLLLPENLYYCNDILDGPFQEDANGCDNLGGLNRYCCRYGD